MVKEMFEYYGVFYDQISNVSFGKDNLICTENTPTCWRHNQRVDLVLHATNISGVK